MESIQLKQYVGKEVKIILQNGFRFTFIMPNFKGSVFSVVDKYGNNVTIDCSSITLIFEKKGGNNG